MARSGTLPAGVLEIEAFADSSDKKIALNVAFARFSKLPAELAATFRTAVTEIESLLLLDRKKNKFEMTGPGFLTYGAGTYNYKVDDISVFEVSRFVTDV